MMKKMSALLVVLTITGCLYAQQRVDNRCLDFMGIPIEGPVDSFVVALKAEQFTEWGTSSDMEDLYFRGNYYGIRAKVMVNVQLSTRFVQSVYVTVGPYRTENMLMRNRTYFLNKLEKEYGKYITRGDAEYFFSTYGSIKVSDTQNANGTTDLNIFYMPSTPYYKDALIFGLKGNVQEVATENPVMENPLERFAKNGKMENPDIIERKYDSHGYLTQGKMLERQGMSVIDYEYDKHNRLIRRVLTNQAARITYVNEYVYNDDDEILNLSQKVFDENNECVMSVNLRNQYEAHDDEGNWTRNALNIVYWEKGAQSQSTNVIQTRKIRYWEE
ncbi:MAG: hypothetical protein IJV17_05060 [Prevotella sp.]|nr:hypothetical protein [Prevotella sp.]